WDDFGENPVLQRLAAIWVQPRTHACPVEAI
ncbi:hypothetical protein A2U01_0111653, partial [Trifolium medium]|nr:hypothetical protein [Trifolium medium]